MHAMTVVAGEAGTAAVDEVADPAGDRWPQRTEEGTQWVCALKTTL